VSRHVDATPYEAHALGPQTQPVAREGRLSARTHDAMAGDARVGALAHHVADGARGQRTAGQHPHQAIGRDPAGRDLPHNGMNAQEPVVGHHGHTARP
jgi:hypothetical protein